jgi:hypothetical protein
LKKTLLGFDAKRGDCKPGLTGVRYLPSPDPTLGSGPSVEIRELSGDRRLRSEASNDRRSIDVFGEKRSLYASVIDVGGPMRSKITITTSVVFLANASAQALDDKACILKATRALPSISGLVVKKAGSRPVPAATLATWQGQARPIIVDLNIVAAGAEETYSYMCVMTNGVAFVRRVML